MLGLFPQFCEAREFRFNFVDPLDILGNSHKIEGELFEGLVADINTQIYVDVHSESRN
jgi:hypothetical protein